MMKKTRYLILLVVLVVLGGTILFFVPIGKKKGPSLSLSPAVQSVKAGETVVLKVLLDTAGQTAAGVDVFLEYDSQKLTPMTPADCTGCSLVSAEGSVAPVMVFPLKQTDGLFSFSGLVSGGGFFSGQGLVGTVHFKALQSGKTTVSFKHQSFGATIDSNIASSKGTGDILKSVTNAIVKIH